MWCLRNGQGQRDGRADEVERAALVGGRLGERWDDGVAVAQVVAGQGGQVVEQVAEAANGLLTGAGLAAGGLDLGGGLAPGAGDRVGAGARVRRA